MLTRSCANLLPALEANLESLQDDLLSGLRDKDEVRRDIIRTHDEIAAIYGRLLQLHD